MLVRPALGANQVRRVGRHAGARTDVTARLEIGETRVSCLSGGQPAFMFAWVFAVSLGWLLVSGFSSLGRA